MTYFSLQMLIDPKKKTVKKLYTDIIKLELQKNNEIVMK